RIDKNMLYLLQQGVPEWCESVKYPANAIIKYNGVLYTAIVENDNSNPATDTTKWKKTQEKIVNASTSQSGVVKLNSATDSTSETEAATPLAVKKANDNASGAVKRSGDNMTGDLYIKGLPALKFADFGVGASKVLGSSSVDNSENQFSGFLFSQSGSAGNKPFDFSHIVRSFAGDSFGDIAIDVLSKRAKFRGVLTYATNPHYTGDYSWTEFVTAENIHNYLPVGIPMPWPNTQPPAGWLECNGSMFNKNQFPKLAAAYPSGELPDLRGEFIRGWDNARGADPGRGILSWQQDAIRNI
ncbi:Phage-related tail fiber protein, partial [Gilliamella apicola SCGC AB-598-I20]